MSGDWIKMRTDLRSDPTVGRLARLTKLDRLGVVGRLYALWSWVDAHAVHGHVRDATLDDVDEMCDRKGFGSALVAVGWLEASDAGVTITKHDRHNGESAKERALKNARQAKWRRRDDGDVDALVDDPVDAQPSTSQSTQPSTDASTREEKRREEEIQPPNPRKRGPSSVHEFPPGFEAFWSAYPRKTAKPKAAQAFARLKVDEALLATLLAAVERQNASPQWTKDGGQFIPHPATWLHGRRWEDGTVSADVFQGAL